MTFLKEFWYLFKRNIDTLRNWLGTCLAIIVLINNISAELLITIIKYVTVLSPLLPISLITWFSIENTRNKKKPKRWVNEHKD